MAEYKILCVDDEALGLRVRKMTLESRGYEVVAVQEPQAALEAFRTQTFDLSILDFAMPEMTGAQLAAEFRRIRPGATILLLSAYLHLEPEHLKDSDGFLTKAGDPRKFLRHVHTLLTTGRLE